MADEVCSVYAFPRFFGVGLCFTARKTLRSPMETAGVSASGFPLASGAEGFMGVLQGMSEKNMKRMCSYRLLSKVSSCPFEIALLTRDTFFTAISIQSFASLRSAG
eukprot:SAG11_NODE_114_length_16040_cov_10.050875_17_plen_106_part_00